jgi:IS66 C-terminal element/Transposase IS66 family/IS66 Orf2 like protein
MIGLDQKRRYFLYSGITDIRKSFDGLSGLVVSEMKGNLLSGDVFMFLNRRWDGLRAYAFTGHLQIDNNKIENLIRPLALGRKNYLFAGSHDGARCAATCYSLFATCKLNGIDPYRWLKDVLSRIQAHSVNRLSELLPLENYRYLPSVEEG